MIQCRAPRHHCRSCGAMFMPDSYRHLDKHFHNLKCVSMYLHIAHQLSFEHLEGLFLDLFGLNAGPPRHFFLSFLGFSIVTNYRTYTLYLLSTTKATTNILKRCEDVPQRFSFPPNAELAIRPSPPILMRWPWG